MLDSLINFLTEKKNCGQTCPESECGADHRESWNSGCATWRFRAREEVGRCLAGAAVKVGSGFGLGLVFSPSFREDCGH